jgi:hypothetical protein
MVPVAVTWALATPAMTAAARIAFENMLMWKIVDV